MFGTISVSVTYLFVCLLQFSRMYPNYIHTVANDKYPKVVRDNKLVFRSGHLLSKILRYISSNMWRNQNIHYVYHDARILNNSLFVVAQRNYLV